jgi:hypothetical protein
LTLSRLCFSKHFKHKNRQHKLTPMKIDPATGKAYLHEWERDLNRIHQAGYSYGYIEIMDLATGEYSWQVDAMKGDGFRVVVEMPTLSEAVGELYKMLIRGATYGKKVGSCLRI